MVTFLPLRLLALLPSPCLARAALVSSLLLSILALFPLRLHAAPNLNPIFHITSRKSYFAAGQEAVRRTAPARKNGETFLSSLCFYPPLSPSSSLFPMPPEVKQFRNILPLAFPAPLSEHARLLCRPAYSTLVEDVITRIPLPLPFSRSFPCFRPSSSLHRCCTLFATQEISWEKDRQASWRIRVSRKISGCLIH